MGLTRNQVYSHGYRGFESLLFRTAPIKKESAHHRPHPGAGFFAPCQIRRAPARAEQKGRKKARAAQRLARCSGGVRLRPDLGADAPPLRGWRAQLALPPAFDNALFTQKSTFSAHFSQTKLIYAYIAPVSPDHT